MKIRTRTEFRKATDDFDEKLCAWGLPLFRMSEEDHLVALELRKKLIRDHYASLREYREYGIKRMGIRIVGNDKKKGEGART